MTYDLMKQWEEMQRVSSGLDSREAQRYAQLTAELKPGAPVRVALPSASWRTFSEGVPFARPMTIRIQ